MSKPRVSTSITTNGFVVNGASGSGSSASSASSTSSASSDSAGRFDTRTTAFSSDAPLMGHLEDLFFAPEYEYVSVTRDPSRNNLSVYKSAARTRISSISEDTMKIMQDTVTATHRYATHLGDDLHHVQQRVTWICADGKALGERVANLEGRLVEMVKEKARTEERHSAEIKFVREQAEKEIKSLKDHVKRIEARIPPNDTTF